MVETENDEDWMVDISIEVPDKTYSEIIIIAMIILILTEPTAE